MSPGKVTFESNQKDPFARELQARVRAYFSENGLSERGNALMVAKTLFYLGGFFALYVFLLASPQSGLTAIGLVLLLGFFSACIGLNVGHDALHGACSHSRAFNRLLGHSFTMIGAHPHNWRILHNAIHHSYTNIAGADGDLHPGKWFRFYTTGDEPRSLHRFQHLYALPLYCLTSLVWVFKKDFDHVHRREHYIYKKPALPRFEFEFLVATKALYLFMFLGLPVLVGGYTIGQTVLGFFLLHVIQGLTLALIFQLGHMVEGPRVLHVTENNNEFDSIYRHQLLGTANFARKNHLVRFIAGGLNYQIEHHLFPLMCHVHYPRVSVIVKEVAAKHGLPYHEFPTMRSALRSHFRLLKTLGNGPGTVSREMVLTANS